MRKTFKYRLYPAKTQDALLHHQLHEAGRLYNGALQERRDAWRMNRISLGYCDQAKYLKEIRDAGDLELANFSCCQDVLRRVDKTFQAFFARVKRGETPGYPRFKPRSRYDSLTFPSYGDGCKLMPNGKLRLQGIGTLKVKLHRPVEGDIKTVTVKREAGRWYVCFSVECEAEPLPVSSQAVGLDVGLESFAVLSDGTPVENPRYFRKAEAQLRTAQRRVARRQRGSRRRRKAVRWLQQTHAHIRHQRQNFHHQVSAQLVSRYGLLAIEDLNIKGLARGMLAKSVADAGWASFIAYLTYKAESAGRVVVKVDPRGTSQRCVCGAPVPKTLKDRWHYCEACGLSVSRDHASALEILRLGLSLWALTQGKTSNVAQEAVCFS